MPSVQIARAGSTSRATAHRNPTSSRATATTAILWPLAIRQVIEARVRPLLRLPDVQNHRRRLPFLPTIEINADLRTMPITPPRLDEHMPAMAIPRFGD